MKSEGSKTAKGRAIQNLVNIESDDKVKAFICTQDLKDKSTSLVITLSW
jgi:DNA gyrase subunit A